MKSGKPRIFRYPGREREHLLKAGVQITTNADTVPMIEITNGDYLCLPKEGNEMKVEGKLLTKMKILQNTLKLCIKAEDMNNPNFRSMQHNWDDITDIYLDRKERV